jgi:hypothetical protein
MTGPRDWDKELAEIDKLMQAPSPGAGAPAPSDPRRATGAVAQPPAGPRPASVSPVGAPRPITVWAVALLGPLGAGALAIWPYDRQCSIPLAIYLVGVLAVLGASIWTMRLAWASRRVVVMVLGILTLLAALGLGAREVLPRVGYAKAELTWVCAA